MVEIRNDTDKTMWVEPFNADVQLILEGVNEDVVYVREPDPCDGPPERVQLDPGQRVAVCTSLSHISLNASGEVGANDAIFWVRIVPDGRDGNVVRGRTLRRDETDDGRRVPLRPGDTFEVPQGSVVVELGAIDDLYRTIDPERPEGSLATALRVWFGISTGGTVSVPRIVVAAAHRHDAAGHLLGAAARLRRTLAADAGVLGRAQLLVKIDELIHLTQEGLVALGRCVALITRARKLASFPLDVHPVLAEHQQAIMAIRHSLEHIDERAQGNIRQGVADARAFMIFDHEPLVRDNTILYLEHVLDLDVIPDVLDACRESIKLLARGPH